MNEGFQSSLDHLLAELERIELRLHLQLLESRQEGSQLGENKFRGLYISEKEIDTIIGAPPSRRGAGSSGLGDPTLLTLAETIEQFEADIAEREKESLRRGLRLRLHDLGRLFQLSKFEIDVLLVCLLPELDLKYQKLYAYLQDDVTKKGPTVDLVLRLLGRSFEDGLTAREAFSPEAPLIKYQLLYLYNGHTRGTAPLLAESLRLDERMTSYLLGSDRVEAHLLPFAHLLQPKVRLADVILPDEVRRGLPPLVARFKEEGLVCYFQGSYGVGKQTTAEAICYELGVPLLGVNVHRMAAADIALELSLPLIFREGLLQRAALYLDGGDTLLSEEGRDRPSYDSLMKELDGYPWWVFLTGEREWEPKGVSHYKPFISIEFPLPSYSARRQLWERHWNGSSPLAGEVDFSELAGKFRLSGGQIRDALATGRNLALWRAPENGSVTSYDLHSACRKQFRGKLSTLARKIQPKYGWDDIILPRDQIEQLREICSYVRYYHTVYGDWGFERKLSTGKGLNVLFAGPSGTGKTMAAEIMANELGLDLYKIDLSAIVSKYIGETEKNLDRIFQEGQTSNAILFFDEADALFGKRSEVRDSHDRYANIEMAYLLQKMDEYEGVVILATNLRKNMDEAFARRMHFAVEFPIPEEADRRRIWENIFPGEAPLAADLDLSFLARQFKITGGNIKNIALSAAFLAAQDGGCITMENLIWATKREYQKMGKLCTESDFAHYFELVKG